MSPPIRISNLSFNGKSFYYLDTNIVLAILMQKQQVNSLYGAEVLQLLTDVLQTNGTVVTSTHTFNEIYSALRADELRRHGYKQDPKLFFNSNPSILPNIVQTRSTMMTSFKNSIGPVITIHETGKLLEFEKDVVTNANIENRDARHLITAVSCGADYFITADKDFSKFDTQDISIVYPTAMHLPSYASVPTITIPQYDKVEFDV